MELKIRSCHPRSVQAEAIRLAALDGRLSHIGHRSNVFIYDTLKDVSLARHREPSSDQQKIEAWLAAKAQAGVRPINKRSFLARLQGRVASCV